MQDADILRGGRSAVVLPDPQRLLIQFLRFAVPRFCSINGGEIVQRGCIFIIGSFTRTNPQGYRTGQQGFRFRVLAPFVTGRPRVACISRRVVVCLRRSRDNQCKN